MSHLIFQRPDLLVLFWCIPVGAAFFMYARWQRRRALRQLFPSESMRRLQQRASPRRRAWKAALFLFSGAAIVLALARPSWKQRPNSLEGTGRDVVFLLDVSRSMLAEDLFPNRLEQAKLAIADALEVLPQERLALVAFAGEAVVKCPLTLDHGFFRLALEETSPESIGRGGSMLGDAIRKTLQTLLKRKENDRHTDLIMLTDGGDQGSLPIEAAQAAGQRGIRIIIIGLGDEREGARIPLPDPPPPPPARPGGGMILGFIKDSGQDAGHRAEGNGHKRRSFLQHQGDEVRSKLDPAPLRAMASATPGGIYFHVGTGTIELGAVCKKIMASAEDRTLKSNSGLAYEEAFQIFLAAALLALALESLIPDRQSIAPIL